MRAGNIARDLQRLIGEGASTCRIGDLLHFRPDVESHKVHLVRVRTRAQARALVTYAGEKHIRLVTLGAGHSYRFTSSGPDPIFVRLDLPFRMSRVSALSVRVPAGATWFDVEKELRPSRRVPITPDYLGLSVAGTIARGGYGIDSARWGMQADHVERIEVLTACGNIVSCGPEHSLFRATIAGLFSVGVILSATLHTIPQVVQMRLATFELDRIEHFIDLFERFHASESHLLTADLTWFPRSRGVSCRFGFPLDQAGGPPLGTRHDRGVRMVAIELVREYRLSLHEGVASWYSPFRALRKVWLDYLIPLRSAREFCEEIRSFCSQRRTEAMLECGYMIPVCRPAHGPRLPFSAAATPGERYVLFGLYFMPLATPRAAALLITRARRSLLQRCVELGGRPYQHSDHGLQPSDCAKIYGSDFDTALTCAARGDTEEIFGSWRTLHDAVYRAL